jgi:CRP-like cAMP-binding protein
MLAKKTISHEAPNSSDSEILEALKHVSLLTEIHHNDLAIQALARLVDFVHFKANVDIIVEGTEGSEMFILMKGSASVFKATLGGEPYKVAILSGDKFIAFGEGGLIGADKRGATIRTIENCDCLKIKREDFEKFASESPAQSVMIRLRQSNEDMLLLYNALVAEIRGS